MHRRSIPLIAVGMPAGVHTPRDSLDRAGMQAAADVRGGCTDPVELIGRCDMPISTHRRLKNRFHIAES